MTPNDDTYEPTGIFWWIFTAVLCIVGLVIPILFAFAMLTFFIALDVQEIDSARRKRQKSRGVWNGK